MSSPSAKSTPSKKDALVGLLDDFLGAKKEQGKYADKVRKAKAAYLELCEFTDYARLSGGRDNAKVVAKLMEDFLVEVKRIHVCVSCRLSRDRREESTQRDGLLECRKDLSQLGAGLRKRLRLLRKRTEGESDHETSPRKRLGAITLTPTTTSIDELRSRCPIFAREGCSRHLCRHCCYYREHECARKLKELRDSHEWHLLAQSPAPSRSRSDLDLPGWICVLEPCPRSYLGFKTTLKSPEGEAFPTVNKAVAHILGAPVNPKYKITSLYEAKLGKRGAPTTTGPGIGNGVGGDGENEEEEEAGEWVTWHGPRESPFGLIEELLWESPWRLLVSCILLNQTTRRQLDPVLTDFFEHFPDPRAFLDHSDRQNVIERVISPLGLQRRRTETLLRFTREFVEKKWTDPTQLHGVGAYASAAYDIFCLGRLDPKAALADHALNWYVEWRSK